MLASIIAFVQSHYLIAFTIASLILNTAASIFADLGLAVPGFIGTALTWIASVTHLINGNPTASIAAFKSK